MSDGKDQVHHHLHQEYNHPLHQTNYNSHNKDIPLYESMNHRDPIYVLPSLLVFLSDAQQDDRDETCIYRLIIIITQSTCIVYVTTIVVLRPFIIDKSYVQISS